MDMKKILKHLAKVPFPKVELVDNGDAIIIPKAHLDSVFVWLGIPAGIVATVLTIA